MTRLEREEVVATFVGTILVIIAAVIMTHLVGCADAPLRPEDTAHIAQHGLTLERCKAEGREAGSYAAYEACKRDGGIQ